MIDSDDEEASEVRLASSQGSQGIEAQFKKRRGREKLSAQKPCSLEPSKFEAQRVLDSVSLPCYHRELRDVPERNVSRWLAQQKKLMVDIFQRRVYSQRHESFISGIRGRGIIPRSEI